MRIETNSFSVVVPTVQLDGTRLTGSCAGASHRPEACSNRGKGAGALCGAR